MFFSINFISLKMIIIINIYIYIRMKFNIQHYFLYTRPKLNRYPYLLLIKLFKENLIDSLASDNIYHYHNKPPIPIIIRKIFLISIYIYIIILLYCYITMDLLFDNIYVYVFWLFWWDESILAYVTLVSSYYKPSSTYLRNNSLNSDRSFYSPTLTLFPKV